MKRIPFNKRRILIRNLFGIFLIPKYFGDFGPTWNIRWIPKMTPWFKGNIPVKKIRDFWVSSIHVVFSGCNISEGASKTWKQTSWARCLDLAGRVFAILFGGWSVDFNHWFLHLPIKPKSKVTWWVPGKKTTITPQKRKNQVLISSLEKMLWWFCAMFGVTIWGGICHVTSPPFLERIKCQASLEVPAQMGWFDPNRLGFLEANH